MRGGVDGHRAQVERLIFEEPQVPGAGQAERLTVVVACPTEHGEIATQRERGRHRDGATGEPNEARPRTRRPRQIDDGLPRARGGEWDDQERAPTDLATGDRVGVEILLGEQQAEPSDRGGARRGWAGWQREDEHPGGRHEKDEDQRENVDRHEARRGSQQQRAEREAGHRERGRQPRAVAAAPAGEREEQRGDGGGQRARPPLRREVVDARMTQRPERDAVEQSGETRAAREHEARDEHRRADAGAGEPRQVPRFHGGSAGLGGGEHHRRRGDAGDDGEIEGPLLADEMLHQQRWQQREREAGGERAGADEAGGPVMDEQPRAGRGDHEDADVDLDERDHGGARPGEQREPAEFFPQDQLEPGPGREREEQRDQAAGMAGFVDRGPEVKIGRAERGECGRPRAGQPPREAGAGEGRGDPVAERDESPGGAGELEAADPVQRVVEQIVARAVLRVDAIIEPAVGGEIRERAQHVALVVIHHVGGEEQPVARHREPGGEEQPERRCSPPSNQPRSSASRCRPGVASPRRRRGRGIRRGRRCR